ncbi:hypothetical protein ACFQXB_01810 [Plastorhodobacter daqingensis]|uniref:Uncharacterized protein n=1 Tax=Plastorhodobacter daqingensis TaxID=1387281 RepID=A0ABW2UHD2_9RHOB
MPDLQQDDGPQLGMFRRPERRAGLAVSDLVAIGLSLLWLIVLAVTWGTAAEERPAPGFALGFILVVVPLALIWVAAATARSLRQIRGEAAQLRATIDALRHAQIAQQQALPRPRNEPAGSATRAAAQAGTPEPQVAPEADRDLHDQPSFDLPEDPPRSTLDLDDLTRALDFPDGPDDHEGIEALQRALADHRTAKLVRAAQDVLTLLAQDGLYMDDFVPDRAHPDLWRRFAAGERGRPVGAVGGIHHREPLAAVSMRMRQDPVFRDAAHHFLRMFDRLFTDFAMVAEDRQIYDFTGTRTARAFMLVGRASGTFD